MLFKSKSQTLLAVADGTVLSLEQVADEAFSSGMLGVGFAIEPANGTIYSPCEGTVESIAETGHAYTLHTAERLDILIHIGIDTVTLKGEGFSSLVAEGQAVRAGDRLAQVNLDILRDRNCPCTVPVLITNPERLQCGSVLPSSGMLHGGRDAVFEYRTR